MIPSEVESLQAQLTEGGLQVEELFAILLSTYELETSKEIFNPSLFNASAKPCVTTSGLYICTGQKYSITLYTYAMWHLCYQ